MALHGKKNKSPQPPVLLAVETATMCGSVALVAADRCIGEYTLQTQQTHSQRLLSGMDHLLGDAGLDWDAIDGIVVSLGPGSFTGLRIGLSTAKGLVLATGKPLIGVATLDGLAAQLPHAPQLLCPVLDARKKEVYAALYRNDDRGGCHRVSDYLVIDPRTLCDRIDEPVLLVGDGVEVYEEVFTGSLGPRAVLDPAGAIFPRASVIGRLGQARWQAGDFLEPAAATPIYIRPSEAELLFAEKQGEIA